MEALLEQADAMVRAAAGDAPQPDFRIPDDLAADGSAHTELREVNQKSRGLFALADIPAGTLLLTAKPIALVMDWQDNSPEDDDGMDDDDEHEPRLNELLLLEILRKLREEPALWNDKLSRLFPRNDSDLSALPAWVCHNDDVFIQVESLLSALRESVQSLPVNDIARRLPLILRYNILSIETCAEMLSYPGPEGHSALAGVGLYYAPSFFNHSARPSVSRWCVGDVMGFVTNQDVRAGTELCISYMEHDVLCEPAWRRNMMLSMDFVDTDDDSASAVGDVVPRLQDQGPDQPVVDSDVQNELMAMEPFQRLTSIDELMMQAAGEKLPGDAEEHLVIEGAMDVTGGVPWFQCDIHNLRILKAVTLDGLGQTADALKLWQESATFVEQKLPPLDESAVVLHAQAALCAWHAGVEDVARTHAAAALRTHSLLFGGGVTRFRRRLAGDLRLSLRPTATALGDTLPADILWPAE